MRALQSATALLLLASACATGTAPAESNDDSNLPGDPPRDAAPMFDAPRLIDAARPIDAGLPDAPMPDAPMPDAMVVAADAGSTCLTAPCDLVQQCGCAAEEACDLADDPLTGNDCRAIDAAGVETDTCATDLDCDAGFTCLADGGGGGLCKPYCDDDSNCSAPRGQCVIQLSSAGTDIPGAVVCSSGCDPTRASAGGCPDGYGCFLYSVNPDGVAGNGDEVPIVDCAAAGNGTQGDLCFDYQDCAPDHLCTDVGLVFNECLRICDNVGQSCAAEPATDCVGFTTDHIVGGTEYGVCF